MVILGILLFISLVMYLFEMFNRLRSLFMYKDNNLTWLDFTLTIQQIAGVTFICCWYWLFFYTPHYNTFKVPL
jgi:hypothetical protein